MIEKFINNLSSRLSNENALSDITWTLCNTSLEFQTIFLDFFFGDDEYNWSKVTDFYREHTRNDSRPDLFFRNNGREYIIEVKINDRNQHFEQYNQENTFKKAKKGYITNYFLEDVEDYELRTWSEFRDLLKTEHNTDPLIRGYRKYLENVCSIKEIRKMNLKGIQSLYYFMNALDKVVELNNDEFTCSKYTSRSNSSRVRQGCYFKVQNNTTMNIDNVWGWIGLYFHQELPIVCVEFEDKSGWGKPYCDLMREGNFDTVEMIGKTYFEDSALYFELSSGKLEEFEEEPEPNKQVDLLKDFLAKVITVILQKAE